MPDIGSNSVDDASGSGSAIVITSNSLQTDPNKVDAIANVLLALERIDQDEMLTFQPYYILPPTYLALAGLLLLLSDSTVLAYVMSELTHCHNYGLDLFLLSVDEGIIGYKDDSLETVKQNQIRICNVRSQTVTGGTTSADGDAGGVDKAVILALDVLSGTVLWQQSIGLLSSNESVPVTDSNGCISIGSLHEFVYSVSPFGMVNKFTRRDIRDVVIQVKLVLDCSGYAVYISQTIMNGKISRAINELCFNKDATENCCHIACSCNRNNKDYGSDSKWL
ncbi:hypothetical protein Tco_1404383 [Tanacetum coccineum]